MNGKKIKWEKIIYYYLNNCKYDGKKGIITEMEKVYSIMKMILYNVELKMIKENKIVL